MRTQSQIPNFEMVATNLRPLAGSGCKRLMLKVEQRPRGRLVSDGRKELVVPEEKLAAYSLNAQRRHTASLWWPQSWACSQPISSHFQ